VPHAARASNRPTPEEIGRRSKKLVFRLLVAVLIVIGFFGSLFAYAGIWPPLLAIESNSLQHSDTASEIGILDTGDLALIQRVGSPEEVVTYVEGRVSGYRSFGDFGDVIAFADPEPNESAILTHRALTFVIRNASGGYDAPELAALPGGSWTGTRYDGSPSLGPYGLQSFTLQGLGWRGDLAVEWNLTRLAANYSVESGFLTFGDRNLYQALRRTDPWILDPSYLIARVRGEIPWLGLLRLTLMRSPDGCCDAWGSTELYTGAPANSWLALHLLLLGLIGTPVGVELFLHRASVASVFRRLLVAARPSARKSRGANGPPVEATSRSPVSAGSDRIALAPVWDFEGWIERIDGRIQRLRDAASDGQ